jgi:tRNA (guanine37-N1)-methyltransferase
MRFSVLTLFPETFGSMLTTSVFGKAVAGGLIRVDLINYRDYAEDKHKVVDDTPFGGGAGMVVKVEPLARALDALKEQDASVRTILLTPQGRRFDQHQARRLSGCHHLAMICGRYEGVDERVRELVDEELSIGDYVLSGGEAAAWVVMEAVSRLVPGVLGCEESTREESFSDEWMLEHPQYTRPRSFRGMPVPEVLLSGDHGAISRWRRRQALLRTCRRRPDLMSGITMSDEERAWLEHELKGIDD